MKLLSLVGTVCVVVALIPYFHQRGGGAVDETQLTVGLTFSPLYVYEKRVEHVEDGNVSTSTTKTRLEVLSVSMALLVAGVLMLSVARAVSKEKKVLGGIGTGASS